MREVCRKQNGEKANKEEISKAGEAGYSVENNEFGFQRLKKALESP